jgi:imidazolonepropionase-like amidohydrolase
LLFVLLLLLATPTLFADAPGVYAITGGTVHTASGADIANGTVIIRNGLIEAVGANVAIPPDAAVIDAKGLHVYPGLIDAQTSLGFPSAQPAQRRRGGGGRRAQQPAEELPETSPAFLALRAVKISDDDADARRAIGVTTIATAPSFGIFNGQSVLLNLGSGSIEQRVIKMPASLQISFIPRPVMTYPDSLMGVIAYIRQTFMDAQQYSAAHSIYEKSPAGLQRPETNESLTALAPVLSRDVPVVFVADSELMIHRAAAIAREFNIRPIYAGARQAYRIADELKASNTPVLVSVRWPVAPAEKEDREEQPLRLIRERQLEPTTPATLAKSGVLFALVSGPGKTGDYLPGIRKAIANGLSADDALRAVTISPARILGVDRQLGSIDKGKIANLVLTDKPIFDKESKVKRILVDGREVRLEPEEKKAKESAPSAIDGTWSVSVRTAQGEAAFRITLHNEDGKLSGSYSGDRGSGDIRSGSFDGTTVEFTIGVKGQQETESGDWVFHGTVSGTSMDGNVNTNLGTFPFSGSKK